MQIKTKGKKYQQDVFLLTQQNNVTLEEEKNKIFSIKKSVLCSEILFIGVRKISLDTRLRINDQVLIYSCKKEQS